MSDIPQLTTEQKLAIREGQLQIANLQNQSQASKEAANQVSQKLIEYINGISSELKVNTNQLSFDINRLVFYSKSESVPGVGPQLS